MIERALYAPTDYKPKSSTLKGGKNNHIQKSGIQIYKFLQYRKAICLIFKNGGSHA